VTVVSGAGTAAGREGRASVAAWLVRHAPWLVLLASLALHLALVPARGWERDLYWWDAWMRAAASGGAAHVDETVWCDYPPVYLYVLEGLGTGWQALFGALPDAGSLASRFLLKLPPVLADLLGAWVLFRLALPTLGRRRSLLVLSAYAFNPATTFNSAVWGQVDSLLGLLLLLAAWAVARGRVALGFAILTVACLFKVQAVVVLPALALTAVFVVGVRAVRGAFLGSSLAALVVLWPFFVAGRADAVLARAFEAVGRYPRLSLNAFNLWWLAGGGERAFAASDQHRIGNALFTAHTLGLVLLTLAAAAVLARLWHDLGRRAEDPIGPVLVGCSLLVLAFFLFPTQIHERYVVPAIILLAGAAVFRPRLGWLYGAGSLATALALASTLKWGYPDGLGPVRGALEALGLWGTLLGPGRHETFVLAVVFVALFAVLLLLGAGRRFAAAACGAGAAAAAVLAAAAVVPLRGDVALSGWTPLAQKQGWGTLQRDRTVDGTRIEVYGYVFRRGIGTHAESVLTYDLNRAFDSFETGYAVDAGSFGNRVRFSIQAQYALPSGRETRTLFDSGLFTGGDPPGHAKVSVRGADRLVLTVDDGGDGIDADHASWLEPTLYR